MANLTAEQRKEALAKIEENLANNVISLGEAIKQIRTNLYGMTQTQYAKFIKISDKTLRDVERQHRSPPISTQQTPCPWWL